MGVVYKARDTRLDRVVALKMILAGDQAGDEARDRFLDEAKAVARLQHPNIVQVFEVGEHNGCPFCALEFCPGGAMSGVLGGAPQDPARRRSWLSYWRRPCTRSTPPGWSTATSSRRTSC